MTGRKPHPADPTSWRITWTTKDLIGEEGLLKQLTKAQVERDLNAERNVREDLRRTAKAATTLKRDFSTLLNEVVLITINEQSYTCHQCLASWILWMGETTTSAWAPNARLKEFDADQKILKSYSKKKLNWHGEVHIFLQTKT